MSPRAACRLEQLGFEQVYDYTAGIAEWKAAGLPVDGDESPGLTIAAATRPDIPTADPNDTLGEVHDRTLAAGWDEVVVVDCDGVVVGRLRGDRWAADRATPVELAMESGPTTVRPDGLLADLVGRMEKRGTQLVVVTDPQGVLIGALRFEDAKRLASGEAAERVWRDCEGCPGRWAAG